VSEPERPYSAAITPARVDAASAVYDLVHALVGTVTDDDRLREVAQLAREATARFDGAPPRVRTVPDFDTVETMRAEGVDTTFLTMGDRPVAGPANPTAVRFEPRWDDDGTAWADVWFGPAFEAAPGRVHGGMVAAVFDDILGMAMARVRSPGFTGRLTVHFRAPVPMNQRIEFKAWGGEPEGRKLVVHSEARLDGRLLAEADALFILVDRSHFETHADDLLDRGDGRS
jgi:acyl-coenzyme A thioesterase PaaI-like protein